MHKLAIGVLAAALALAACGSSSTKSGSGSNASTTTSPGGGSSGSGSLSDLVNKAKTANFKITYTGADGKSQTVVQDGNGKTAVMTDSSVIISDGTKTISCDGKTASATCTDLGAAGAGALSGLTALYTTAYAGLAGLNSSVYGGHTSSDTIAGRDAKCITYKASDVAGGIANIPGDPSLTACVDAQTGVLLKYSTTSNGKSTDEFLATSYAESSASDFNPPSTPATAPSLPGQ